MSLPEQHAVTNTDYRCTSTAWYAATNLNLHQLTHASARLVCDKNSKLQHSLQPLSKGGPKKAEQHAFNDATTNSGLAHFT